jgi:hypothetical protein
MASIDKEISADKYNRRFESYLDATDFARQQAEKCRDYYDHKQWTSEEVEKLKKRKQAPIVVNRIQPKVDAMKGLLINQRTDPKAYPRTPKHEQASYAITDSLRFIHDHNDFDYIEQDCADDFFVEGTCAAIIELDPKTRNIKVNRIPWDRYYYDPHSRMLDFSDKKFDGIVLWMDLDDAIDMFPDQEDELTTLVNMQGDSSETYDDKPIWIDRERKRVKICQEFAKEKGTWYQVYYTYQVVLDKQVSPYLDEDGDPVNPIVSASAYIDRELNRFGPCLFWLDLQDEINHRRSKALHIMSQRQTAGRRGAIQDIQKMKRELAKPDGHVEYDGDHMDFQILQTNDMATAQFSLLAEAKQDLDSISVNAQLSGQRAEGDLSGKAIQSLQAGGMLELAPVMSGMHRWRKQCFRQMWFRVRQFWNEEKWVRVTDDYNMLRWVGINQQVPLSQLLQETVEDESLPPDQRTMAAMQLEQMAATNDPRLNETVEVRNDIANIGVDIILDVMPDTLTIQNEQFQLLAQLGMTRPEVPFSSILKLSQIRDKDAIIEELEAQVQASSQLQQMQTELEVAEKQADIENTQTDTAKKQQEAVQKQIENLVLMNTPVSSTNVSV